MLDFFRLLLFKIVDVIGVFLKWFEDFFVVEDKVGVLGMLGFVDDLLFDKRYVLY